MATYRADNGKYIDTDKLDHICNMDYEGCYGTVACDLYRTRRSHQWYAVSESSWAGVASISDAEALSLRQAAEYLAEHDGVDSIADYPELSPYSTEIADD